MGQAQRLQRESYNKSVIKENQELEKLVELDSIAKSMESFINKIPTRQINEWDTKVGAYYNYRSMGAGKMPQKQVMYIINTPRVGNAERAGTKRIWASDLQNEIKRAKQNTINAQPRINQIRQIQKCRIHPDVRTAETQRYGELSLQVTNFYHREQFPTWDQKYFLWNKAISLVNKARSDLEKHGLRPTPCNKSVPIESPMDIAYTHNKLMSILGKSLLFPTKNQSLKLFNSESGKVWNKGLVTEITIKDKERKTQQALAGVLEGRGVTFGKELVDLSIPRKKRDDELRKKREDELKKVVTPKITHEKVIPEYEIIIDENVDDYIKKTSGILVLAGLGYLLYSSRNMK
jgi:hypothetical protein